MQLLLFLAIGNLYGVSEATEVVFFIYAPVAVIIGVALGVADVIVMPAMHRAMISKNDGYLRSALTKYTIFFIVPLSAVVFIVSTYYVDDVSLKTLLLMMLIPLLGSISALHIGFLNSFGSMRLAVLGPLYGSIVALPVVFLVDRSQESLAFVLLVYEASRMIGLKLNLTFKNIRIEQRQKNPSAALKTLLAECFFNAKWQIIGSLLLCLNSFVDIIFAKQLAVGSVTLVEYASRLWNLVPLLFTGMLITLYSKMSKASAIGEIDKVNTDTQAVKLGFLSFCIALVAALMMSSIISIIFGLGVMSENEKHILARLTVCYLIGTIPFVSGMVYVRALSAEQRVVKITIVALINFLSNIILNYLFVNYWGIYGIGIATSVVYTVGLVLLFILYRR